MKKYLGLFFLLVMALAGYSCNDGKSPAPTPPSPAPTPTPTPEPDHFGFESDIYQITVDQEIQIKLKNFEEPDFSNVSFSSSNPTCADISPEGIVKGFSEGNAKITARYKGKKATCEVKVISAKEYDLRFEESLVVLKVGESVSLELFDGDAPYNGDAKINWVSSDPSLMTVDQNGKIKAIAFGGGVIMAENSMNPENSAKLFFRVDDGLSTEKVDMDYISSPFPYLKYPADEDEIAMAERCITCVEIPLRKLVNREEEGEKVKLSYFLRNFLGYNPPVIIFGQVFYTIKADTKNGEPFCYAYAHGIKDEGQVEVFGSYFLEKLGFGQLQKISIGDKDSGVSMTAWRAVNLKQKISVLVYLKSNQYGDGEPSGVVEWRLMDGDPYKFNE